jgi:type IV pilus assembly protein PilB
MDFRVSVLPTLWGEKIVMRLLDKGNLQLDMTKLGFDQKPLDDFLWAIHQPWGMVLVTGPTGSGKTTTLYAALGALNTPDKTLITIEDPVEYKLGGIKQIQVNNKVGLSFAMGLRSMLRSDPNVIMVGEIRDRETAQIAVESALTGHLVLSTLHTNDAPSAVTRLVEMGIEPFLVASSIECVVAQRLARTLCSACRVEAEISSETLFENGFGELDAINAYEAKGCRRCGGTGYKGRIGLYETMPMTDEIRALALERGSASALAETARAQGMTRLREDGLDKVRGGLTTVPEVVRVTGSS